MPCPHLAALYTEARDGERLIAVDEKLLALDQGARGAPAP